MHVLVVPSTYPSNQSPSTGIFFQLQARALKKMGFRVGVIAPILISLRLLPQGFFRFTQGMTVDDEEGIPIFRYYQWAWLSQIKKGNLILWENAARRLFEQYIEKYGKPDILHAHEAYLSGEFASKVKQKYGTPYILTEHSSFYARELIKNWQIPGLIDAFQNASHRVVVSPQLGRILEEKLGKVVRPWIPIPNILDPLFSDSHLLVREKPDKLFRFLNIAFMMEKKGQLDLLEAFSNKFAGVEDVVLRLGGDGPLRKHLERLSAKLGIEHKVEFLGMLNRKQVLDEMRNCDVFVLPSHTETFGVVLIEALACGKPVLSTACGGPESIINSINGLLVPPRDVASLGEGLNKMYLHRDRYDPQTIRQDCLSRYSENVIANQLSSLIRDVVQGYGKGNT
jgi:glycosyltransferase involved in cell wall biosynthesis